MKVTLHHRMHLQIFRKVGFKSAHLHLFVSTFLHFNNYKEKDSETSEHCFQCENQKPLPPRTNCAAKYTHNNLPFVVKYDI